MSYEEGNMSSVILPHGWRREEKKKKRKKNGVIPLDQSKLASLVMLPPIWVIKLSKTSHIHSYPILDPLLMPQPYTSPLVLLGLGRVVFPLAGVPEEQRDANGGQSHHTKSSPVQL